MNKTGEKVVESVPLKYNKLECGVSIHEEDNIKITVNNTGINIKGIFLCFLDAEEKQYDWIYKSNPESFFFFICAKF